MRKLILFVVLGLAVVGLTLRAAPQGTPNRQGRGVNVERRIGQMQRQLGLSPDQVEKIRPILQDENSRIQSLRQGNSANRAATAKDIRQIRQDSMKQLESVLTKEQADKLHQQRRPRNNKKSGAN